MKLCRYWANAETTATDTKGRTIRLRKWGGSNDSVEDAKRMADRALQELTARLDTLDFRRRREYSYSMREVPEELVKEISKDHGITRNGKGCLVLNSATAFFADIDIGEPGLIARLFFGATREKREQEYIDRLRGFIAANSDVSARVYRTKAGLRYLFTHAPLPVNGITLGWLEGLGSDRMYVRLCRNQKCYRARLTPKPYRLGCARVMGHFPFDKPGEKEAFESWLRAYEQSSEPYAVCSFIGTEGSGRVHSEISAVVEAHDRAVKVNDNLPLA